MAGLESPAAAARLLEALLAEPSACLRQARDGAYRLVRQCGALKRPVPRQRVAALLAAGLLQGGPHLVRAAPEAADWLKRRAAPDPSRINT